MLSLFKKPLKHILLIGGSVGGRTTLLYHNIIHHTDTGKSRIVLPTIGFNREEFVYNEIKFVFLDYGTSIYNVRTLLKKVYPITNGVMFLIDSTLNSKEEKEDSIKYLKDVLSDQTLQNIPIAIIMNKSDRPKEITANDILTSLYNDNNYDKYFKGRLWKFFETSTYNQKSIDDVLHWMYNTIQINN